MLVYDSLTCRHIDMFQHSSTVRCRHGGMVSTLQASMPSMFLPHRNVHKLATRVNISMHVCQHPFGTQQCRHVFRHHPFQKNPRYAVGKSFQVMIAMPLSSHVMPLQFSHRDGSLNPKTLNPKTPATGMPNPKNGRRLVGGGGSNTGGRQRNLEEGISKSNLGFTGVGLGALYKIT